MFRILIASLALGACATVPPSPSTPLAPKVDYHQHLVSPEFAPIVKLPERDGAALLAELDAAGIQKAVVLSVGYSYADERKGLSDPDQRTRFENDWTAQQVRDSNGRLIGFCSANPLRPLALEEMERCLGVSGMVGVKLHLGNAGVTLRDAAHVQRLQQVFALAQRLRAPVLVHMRPRGGADYGAVDARTFLDRIVPMAPRVPIIIAHLGASSPGYSAQNDEIMAAFAEAAGRRDRRMRNLYFDVAANVTTDASATEGALVARRIRQIGPRKFLYGTDLSAVGGSIRASWETFSTKVPLTRRELAVIANNRLPFTR